jgi:hypothetical protein
MASTSAKNCGRGGVGIEATKEKITININIEPAYFKEWNISIIRVLNIP